MLSPLTTTLDRLTNRLLQGTVLAACLLLLSYSKVEPDLWGHVQYGLDALRDGLPEYSTYTYTAPHERWINHELLSELALAVGWTYTGASGLLIAKCLSAAALLTRIGVRARRTGASEQSACGLMVITALNLAFFWVLRPQLFSFWLLFLLLEMLASWSRVEDEPKSHRFPGWQWVAIPLLFATWANTHGAFLAGLAIFVALVALRIVERLVRARSLTNDHERRQGRNASRREFLLATLAVFATFVNPYGARLHAWMIDSLIQPRPEIVEWLPPPLRFEVASLAWLPFWTLLVAAISAVCFGRRPKDWPRLIILALIAWQAVEHRRHIAIFALLSAYWLPDHLHGLFHRLGTRTVRPVADTSSFAAFGFLGVTAAALLFILGQLWSPLQLIAVHRDLYPVAAFQYAAEHGLRGKAVVSFAWAQYAIMALGGNRPDDPPIRVHFDGRYDTCYPRQVVDMHFDFEQGDSGPGSRYRGQRSLPLDRQLVLDFCQPDLLILNRNARAATAALESRQSDWTLLYQDSLAQIWGRTSEFGTPGSRRFIPPEHRHICEALQQGISPWPALP